MQCKGKKGVGGARHRAGKDLRHETRQQDEKTDSIGRGGLGGRNGAMPVTSSRLLSADHKTVGTLYFVFAIVAGIIGVALSVLIRMQMDGLGVAAFNRFSAALFSSAHGLVMLVFMMVPALFCGFGNWLIPLMGRTVDMAFPRLNLAGFWLLVLAFFLFIAVLFPGIGRLGTTAWLITALHIAALSVVFSAVNFIVTIVAMRMPGMALSRMPPFMWSLLIASFLMLMCVPIMASAVTLWLSAPALQAQGAVFSHIPELQVMLWFFSHPEIYILLLPAFGIISHVVAAFAGRALFAQKAVVPIMMLTGLAGFVLWTQNLFHPDNRTDIQSCFPYILPVIGLSAAFMVLCWCVTIRRSRIVWQTPMLWAGGFIFTFSAGIVVAFHLALSQAFSESPMVFVSYFHYVVSLGAVFAIFAGWYFWFPHMSGFIIREQTGKLHFWMLFVAVNLIFLPQHFQNFAYDPHSPGFMISAVAGRMRLSTLGAVLAACSVGVFLYGIAEAFIRKKPANIKPWGPEAAIQQWPFCASAPQAGQQGLQPVSNSAMLADKL